MALTQVQGGMIASSQTITSPTLTTPTLTSPTINGTYTAGTSLITSGTAVASTSGTSIDFTSIPNWVKRITVMFNGVSTSGSSAVIAQLGTSSGVTTTGYLGSCFGVLSSSGFGVTNYTTGFGLGSDGGAGYVRQGSITISLQSSNSWVCSGSLGQNDSARMNVIGGSIALGGVLDRVRITTVNGTDTFDAGSINILYE